MRSPVPSPTTLGPARAVRGIFDAPTGTEWSAYRATPRPARVYIALLVLAAVAVTLGAGAIDPVSGSELAALGGLAVAGIASGELGRLAEGARVERQRIHKGLSAWAFAAALLLGPGLAGWIAVVVYLHAWARGVRITLWKWIGSCAIVILAALAASATLEVAIGGTLPALGSPGTLPAVVAAVAVFLAVESGLLLLISRLNAEVDEVYLRAQLASVGFYLVETSVLATGVLVAAIFRYEPAFLLLLAPATLLVQRGLLHEPLQEQARTDAKTGVLNADAWHEAAASTLYHARREGRPLAVLLVDVDHFKDVNDTFGHLAGDDVLAKAADTIVRCVRRTDVVGRFGGDEFCAVLSCNTVDEAWAAAERVCSRIGQLSFGHADMRVTASVGVAVTGAVGADLDLDGLVATADQALYDAKSAGRDRVCVRGALTVRTDRAARPTG